MIQNALALLYFCIACLRNVEFVLESSPHIIVVDDHRDIRDLVRKYLEQHGYHGRPAESALALRRLLERSSHHLIILDVMMPGEDGLSVCRQLHRTIQKIFPT